MSATLVAELATRSPARTVRLYLTEQGMLHLSEYEKDRPTVRAVMLTPDRIPDLIAALQSLTSTTAEAA